MRRSIRNRAAIPRDKKNLSGIRASKFAVSFGPDLDAALMFHGLRLRGGSGERGRRYKASFKLYRFGRKANYNALRTVMTDIPARKASFADASVRESPPCK